MTPQQHLLAIHILYVHSLIATHTTLGVLIMLMLPRVSPSSGP